MQPVDHPTNLPPSPLSTPTPPLSPAFVASLALLFSQISPPSALAARAPFILSQRRNNDQCSRCYVATVCFNYFLTLDAPDPRL